VARVANGHEFEAQVVHVLSWKDHLVPQLRDAGVRTTSLGVASLADLRWVLRLRAVLRSADVDIIHSHSPLIGVVARLVSRTWRGRPVLVSTEHNVWKARRWPTRWWNAITYTMDDAHVAVSGRVRDSLPRRLRRSTMVIDHGVDVASIAPMAEQRTSIRRGLGIADDQLVICTIANFRWQKGYPELLNAVRRVVDAGRDVLVLAIGQGPLEGDVLAERQRLGLDHHVRLLGHRFDAVQVVAASDIFALASRHEGYPIVVLEALAAGVPVVSTDVGAVPAVITHGRQGFIVSVGDDEALASALLQLIDDPALRARMSTAAAERGSQFDIRTSVAHLVDLYRTLTAVPPTSPS
jgi:glycosyltransferase involved in cell wall biosynthesis